MNMLSRLVALALIVSTGVCRAQALSHEDAASSTTEGLHWPERHSVMVRPVAIGPWRVVRVGLSGLGGLSIDRAAQEAIASHAGVEVDTVVLEVAGSTLARMPAGELSATARAAGKPEAGYEVLTLTPRDEWLDLQRTTFVYYLPRVDDEANRRDVLVVVLPGMFGTPEPVVDAVVGQIRARGYHVLRMLTQPSRFTQYGRFTLDPEGDVQTPAREAAALFSDLTAECAIAVEAACAALGEAHEDAPVGRRAIVGMSGGGMVTPTVVAREPDAYAAAIMIGAGCDFAQIAIDSNYDDFVDAIRVEWDGDPLEEVQETFNRTYRESAMFDSYNTAEEMPEIPVLMLHGTADRAVPSAMGDLLWERLGEPERWTVPAGHEVLFLAYLPAKAGEALDWLDESLSEE